MCYLFYCLIELGYSRKTRHRLKKRRLRGFRQENRPNIILILADDLDVALGSPDAMKKTKKLLREGGTDFVNTFVTSSICCPSRSSILTGKYSHNHFINSNRGNCSSTSWQRGAERNSYGRLLQDAGYITGECLYNFSSLEILYVSYSLVYETCSCILEVRSGRILLEG